MKKTKEVLQKQELKEAKGGIPEGSYWCPEINTCPFANPQCHYQHLPAGYIIPCLL